MALLLSWHCHFMHKQHELNVPCWACHLLGVVLPVLQIIIFHHCTNLLHPDHICISYYLHTPPSLIHSFKAVGPQLAYKRGSKGGFTHASRAAGSILLSTSNTCTHHACMHQSMCTTADHDIIVFSCFTSFLADLCPHEGMNVTRCAIPLSTRISYMPLIHS
jgi:hypothetical protein